MRINFYSPVFIGIFLFFLVGSITFYKVINYEKISSFPNTISNENEENLTLSLGDVLDHNTEENCWTKINNGIYNITSYIPIHPGGRQNILRACGIDATEIFNTKGGSGTHSLFAHSLLFRFLIGYTNGTIGVIANSSKEILLNDTILNTPMCISNNNLAGHSSSSDCWLIINNKVYDVTSYIPIHPGGQQKIISSCGKDATLRFNTKDGIGNTHSAYARSLFDYYFIGNICQKIQPPLIATILQPLNGQQFPSGTSSVDLNVSTNEASICLWSFTDQSFSAMNNILGSASFDTFHSTNVGGISDGNSYNLYVGCKEAKQIEMISSVSVSFSIQSASNQSVASGNALTAEIIALHNIQSDCWLIINNKVYDVTSYIPIHPGGQQKIISSCGKDATITFQTQGGQGSHSSNAWNLLNGFYIGNLGQQQTNPSSTNSSQNIPTISEAILAQYPDAVITEINEENNGKVEVHFTSQGETMSAKLDANHNIIEVED